MAKGDIRERLMRGIQPGLAPIPPQMDNKFGGSSLGDNGMEQFGMPGMRDQPNPSLLQPNFADIMPKSPHDNQRQINTQPSVMQKFNRPY